MSAVDIVAQMLDAYRSSWTDIAAHLQRRPVAVLPFGALEQHGPHLPVGTDTATATEVARRIAEGLDAVLLPPVHYGDTWNNAGYPGTISLRPATVTAIAEDIGRAIAASGARLLVVVNGDWGNRNPLAAAMRTLEEEGTLHALTLNYPGMDEAIAAVQESEPAAPGLNHAEEVETSIMLVIAPDDVHTDRYEPSYPSFPSDFGTRPMQLHPFSSSGVFGDPSSATEKKGERIIAATVAASLAVLEDALPSD